MKGGLRRVWLPWGAAAALLALVGTRIAVRWGTRWGSTPGEQVMSLPGDSYLDGGPAARVAMTRAVSLAAPPDDVWPWLAQLGRGAGWYTYDRLDNGSRDSARHLVLWVPPPEVGDATAIGYLRRLDTGRALTWWLPGERLLGASMRMVFDVHLTADGDGSRLVARVSGDVTGSCGRPIMFLFEVIDSIMARRQLLGLKERVEAYSTRSHDPDRPETGAHDEFQLYEVIYASGESAGVPGREKASQWRAAAIEDGVLGFQPSSVESHTGSSAYS